MGKSIEGELPRKTSIVHISVIVRAYKNIEFIPPSPSQVNFRAGVSQHAAEKDNVEDIMLQSEA